MKNLRPMGKGSWIIEQIGGNSRVQTRFYPESQGMTLMLHAYGL